MRTSLFKFIAAALLAISFHAAMAGDEHATKEEAVAFVKKAIAYIKQNGKEKAIVEFGNPQGQFIDRELYIVALDLNGVVLTSGGNPKLAGKALLDIKDGNGKQFVREEIEVAKNKGKGWVDFAWVNPVTKKIEPRSVYLEKIDDYIVLSGVYKER
jgi:signal transduction histidine kinase